MPRGGSRDGAGRPTLGEAKAKMASYRLPPEVVQAIRDKAEAAGVSQARLIALAVDAYRLD